MHRVSPPPRSLGIHDLPADTHNGDQITVEDQACPKAKRDTVRCSEDPHCSPDKVPDLPTVAPVQDFVVTSLVLKYKLVGGRYQRDHNRLEVQQTSRYFVNLYYDSLLEKSA